MHIVLGDSIDECEAHHAGEPAIPPWIVLIRRVIVVLVMVCFCATQARAQTTQTWDPNGAVLGTGGTGTWDTTSPLWTPDGTTFVSWNNAAGDAALFAGVTGTVTVAVVTVHDLTFNTDSYVLDSGTITLTGAAATITVGAAFTTTINSVIAGPSALTLNGSGTLVLGGANTYAGATTVSNGTLTVRGSISATSGVVVGDAGAAVLRVESGGKVISGGSSIGSTVGSSGTAVVTDAGSTWTDSGGLTIGDIGTGVLTVQNGGAVQSSFGLIGFAGGSQGSVTVTGTGSNWINTGPDLIIGNHGTGTLTIADGATVSAPSTFIGFFADGTGALNIGAAPGSPAVAPGSLATPTVAMGAGAATINFNHNATNYVFAPAISGAGTVNVWSGTTTLTASSTYSGNTNVNGGTLLINGSLGNTATTVSSGATLGGTGTIAGGVTVASGATLAPGAGGAGTLTLGSVILQSGSLLAYDLGTPNVVGGANDLLQVNGDLTLGGSTLNVTDIGAFASAPGSYRLINYTGTLTGSAGNITLGTLPGVPPNSAVAQTAVAGQVNLVVNNGLPVNFWDGPNTTANGAVDGGTGTWNNSSPNWTNVNGTFQQAYIPGLAVFGGTAGTVTLAENVSANVLQFSTNGYTVTGGSTITMLSQSLTSTLPGLIRTDAGVTATIDAALAGLVGIEKGDAGTLILTGANSYTGGSTITAGTLQIGNGGTTGTLGAGAIADNAALVFNRSNTLAVADVIRGTGTVAQAGTGTTVLTADNTYTGATTVSSGTLQLGNGNASAGSFGIGTVTDNGVIVFNRSSTTVSSAVSGTGALQQVGSGTVLTLTGASTYTGGTTIAAGATLQLGAGGTTGAITGQVTDNGTLVFNRSDSQPFAGLISGTGALVKSGIGTTSLTAANTYTGGTTITAGTLQIGNGASSGDIVGNVVDNGTLTFNRADVYTFGGVISGTGAVNKLLGSVTTLTGNSSYTGTTTIAAGFLKIGNAGTTGAIGPGDVIDLGTLELSRSDDITFANNVSGSGGLIKTETSTTTLIGNNTFKGTTTISAGTLQIGNGGTAGTFSSANIAVSSGALLAINHSDPFTLSGVVSGAGGLAQRGTNTTTLTGANTYTGPTTIAAGTLRIGNGGTVGTLGTSTVNMAGGTVLAFNRTDRFNAPFAVPNTIAGTGTINQIGTGGTALNGTVAANTININAGALFVNGTATVPVVRTTNGSTLGGTGSLVGGLVTMASGATLAPGARGAGAGASGIGTLTLPNLTLEVGSVLAFDLAEPGIVGGLSNDLLVVNGDVILSGTTLNITDAGSFASTPGYYRLVNYSGTETGAISNITLGTTPGYLPGEVLLQTAVPHQLNLLIAPAGLTVQFWDGSGPFNDGTIQGGTGVWNNATANWTDDSGLLNVGWVNGIAVFTGTAGTVTLGQNVSVQAMQFVTDGYVVEGAGHPITLLGLNGGSVGLIRTSSGATSIVHAVLTGTVGLRLSDPGTTILTEANTYTGITTIEGGTLQIGNSGTTGSVPGAIVDNAALAFSRSDNITFPFAISGTGTLTKLAAGKTTLTATNTYGGTTTIKQGVLEIGAGGTSGTLGAPGNVVIASGANLLFDRSDVLTVANSISGAGTVTKIAGGTTALTGANSWSGITTITAGTLQMGNAGATGNIGTGAVTIAAASSLTANRNNTLTLANNISGAGSLLQIGTGTTILTGAGTYTGGTTITAGTLQIGNSGAIGSIAGDVTDNSILAFARSNTYTFAGVISGAGGVSQIASGTTILTAANTYAGATAVNAGTLQIGGGGTTGTVGAGAVTINSGGTLTFNRSNTLQADNVIGGVGQVKQIGSGTTILTADDTYGGGTVITAGTLQLGNGGATGSVLNAVGVDAPGTLAFNRNNTYIVGSAIVGTGAVSQIGTGATVLTVDNTYTGPTTISAGTLQLGNATSTGAIGGGAIAISTGATLRFNRTNALAVANTITGTGTIAQIGAGATTLSGAAAAFATNVGAGSLLVTGTLTSPVTVASGATLGGTGTIVGAVTVNGGTVAPGLSPGTLTMGALTLNNGSILNYELGAPNIVGGASNDLLVVNGALTLSGTTTVNVADAGAFVSTPGTYRLINYTGGLTGNDTNFVLGTLAGQPPNASVVQTAVAGQVNLIVSNGLPVNFWDGPSVTNNGAVDGGTGTWNNITPNWTNTNGSFNQRYITGLATFGGTSGTVTLGENVSANVIQFTTSGYTVNPTGAETITLLSQAGAGGTTPGLITTDAGVTTTISAPLAGAVGLEKNGAGTLLLTGTSTYTGGTTVTAGTLQIGNNNFGGVITGDIVNNATVVTSRTNIFTFSGVMSGAGALVKQSIGALVLTGNNTYSGTTTISAGTLQVGSGGATGTLGTGSVVDDATLTFNRNNPMVVANAISGTGAVTQAGAGTTVLTGANTYSGITTISAGTLQIGNGGTTGRIGAGAVANAGTLAFNRSDAAAFANAISGAGVVTQIGGGATTLTGPVAAGGITVTAGSLFLNNTITTPTVTTSAGTTLGGSGSVSGITTVAGTLAPGAAGAGSVGVMTLGGLVLQAGSILAYDLGTPNAVGGANNDLLQVNGNLTLRGSTLNITDAGAFASTPGSYRLINYTGTLTGNASNIALGVAPGYAPGQVVVQTAVTGEVNLIATVNGLATQFWDGGGAASDSVVAGGNGTWNNTLGNWTNINGSINQSWLSGFGVFGAAAGTVTLGENVNVAGLQFSTTGYVVNGNGNTVTLLGLLGGQSVIRVNNGVTTTFNAPMAGTAGLQKANPGTLILTADSNYSGGTLIAAGTLQLGSGGVSGSIAGDVIDNATLTFNRSDSVTFGGAISGAGAVTQAGTGTTILTGTNSYGGATTISAGTLQIGAGGTAGTLGTAGVVDNALLAVNRSDSVTIANPISGTGQLQQVGTGATILTAANTYSGPTSITAGTLQIGNGGTAGSIGAGAVANAGTLAFNRSDAVTFANTVTGAGTITQLGAGATTLSGTVAAGTINVNAGSLLVTGAATAPTVTTASGATLGGTGSISGTATIAAGGAIAPGVAGAGTLTLGGLVLQAGSILAYDLGTPNVAGGATNDLLQVNGSLTLGGSTLNVTDTGAFASSAGSYRLINYTGTLTGNASGITLGALPGLPPNTAVVQTAVTGQVNLIVSNGLATNFWDGPNTTANGAVDGGTGTWNNTTSHWTNVDGSFNQAYIPGLAIFSGAAGTVTLGASVAANVMQFTTTGYVVNSTSTETITLLSQAGAAGTTPGLIRTDAGVTATITVPIAGTVGLEKGDPGTLILAGANTYTGGTTISAGTLQIGNGGAAGSIVGDVVDNGTLTFSRTDVSALSGVVSGSGALVQAGSGTTILSGASTYTGGTTINAGTLQIGAGGAAGSIVGNVANNGALAFNRSDSSTIAGVVGGAGQVTQAGTGTTILTAANTYSGGTTISAGTLQLGNGGATGSIAGNVTDNGTVAFNRSDATTFAGVISGTGRVTQAGTGATILTAANIYTGGTTITAGTLQIGAGGTTGSIVGNVADNGVLAFNRSDAVTFAGAISGTGQLTQLGTGSTTLTADSTYNGAATISAGTLALGNGGTTGTVGAGGIGIAGGALLTIDRSNTLTLANAINGAGNLSQVGTGTTILSGTNGYTGTTLISAGGLQIGNGGATGTLGTGAVTNLGTLTFSRSDALSVANAISGVGTLVQSGTGTTTLTGLATASSTLVNAGTLSVANALASPVTVNSGGTLAGIGSVVGPVTVNGGGTLSAGDAGVGHLTTLSLTLNTGSVLAFDLGATNVVGGPLNDLITVNGALALNGTTLNVTDTGAFASTPGSYRLIDYSGALTGSASNVTLGTLPGLPPNTAVVQTAVATQVNLIVSNGLPVNFWDGTPTTSNGVIDGGNGTWNNSTPNWTNANGTVNQSYIPGLAIFAGAAGTATLAENVTANVLQFTTNGYVVSPTTSEAITLQSQTGATGTTPGLIRTDAGVTATIAATIAGSVGLEKGDAGTLILAGTNTYIGGTTITAGTLQIGNGGTTGGILGDIANAGTLVFNRSNTQTFAGAISGAGAVTQSGAGTTILTAANTYTGSTTISAGVLQIGNGGTTGSFGSGAVANGGTLAFDRSDAFTVVNSITGSGALLQVGTGTTTLTGAVAAATTTVSAGTLSVASTLTSAVTVTGTLAGVGTVAGPVTVSSGGTLSPGNVGVSAGVGHLTTGNLTLGAGSILNMDLGASDVVGGPLNDLITVNGSLTLAGTTLNVADTGAFGSTLLGLYRLIDYSGTLTGSAADVTVATTPGHLPSEAIIQTAVPNQVNLAIAPAGEPLEYWDGHDTTGNGVIDGGNGTWNTSSTNWTGTNGTVNAGWLGGIGVLQGAAGTITLGEDVSMRALQIVADGYVIQGAGHSINLNSLVGSSHAVIRATAGTTSVFDVAMAGATGLTISDPGTLILAADNTYAGGTTLVAGTLQLGNGGTTGSIVGDVVDGGTLAFNRSNTMILAGVVSGAGAVVQAGTGTTVLTGANTYTGGTTITAGTLQIGNGGTSGSIVGDVTNNGVLGFNRSDTMTFAGVISGSGNLNQAGTGTTILTGANTYAGATNVSAGTLQIGAGGATGTLGAGAVLNNGTLAFNRSDAITVANAIAGTGALVQAGTGSTSLTGIVAAGSTNVAAGTLRVNGTLATPALTVATGATLGGAGTIIGAVTVANGGTLAPGNSPGTLTMSSLLLSPGSILNYELDTPNVVGGVNDLVVVNGDLTLAGTLNVTALSGFGLGVYRLINYTGTLTDNVLALGTMPTGYAYAVNNVVPGQVNLQVITPTPPDIQVLGWRRNIRQWRCAGRLRNLDARRHQLDQCRRRNQHRVGGTHGGVRGGTRRRHRGRADWLHRPAVPDRRLFDRAGCGRPVVCELAERSSAALGRH